MQWVIHKFGGTSVANADRYKNVSRILKSEPGILKGIVVSAMSGVTNALLHLIELAQKKDDSYLVELRALQQQHLTTISELLPSLAQGPITSVINADCHDLEEILRGIYLTRNCSKQIVELISGYGELWSAQFLDAYLRSCGVESKWLDARKVLVVHHNETAVSVDWDVSKDRMKNWLKDNSSQNVIITGFIASNPEGIPTTLGRNGSDFSASIFGALLDVSAITIWTDVNGVLSADPRLVPDAVVLDEMSYNEATELAYFGAKVLHPGTMAPAIKGEIPIWIRNTGNSSHPGTKIHGLTHLPSQTGQSTQVTQGREVKGFATIDNMALVNVEGTGMLGVPGIAQRLFGALREVNVSVVMISQASSEHSICFVVPQAQAGLAKTTVENTFFSELQRGQIQSVTVTSDCTVLAAVGDNMVHLPGVAGRFFSAFGKAGVNIRAIAQGSSERNISAVIDRCDATRALRVVHSSFYLSNQTISIGLIGPGLIGKTLLEQLEQELTRLKSEFRIDLRIRAIAGSQKMILADDQIDLSTWKKSFNETTSQTDLQQFASHVLTDYLPHAVIIDCTASQDIPKQYIRWLEMGIHIITPNKKANASSMDFYRALRRTAQTKKRHFLYQTNVGAGLPILGTLRDLVQTGDRIEQIEGIVSGTLSYLFNKFEKGTSFSALLKDAQSKGYTEPDPREDLSGSDVARKLVILAREVGLSIELEQISIESLADYSDEKMNELLEAANVKDEVLRYVGAIAIQGETRAEIQVKLKSYPRSHPFSRCSGSDNMVAFKTARYNTQPLIVQGPGAGPAVTAAGVFADLLRLASYLGGTS